eukprot:5098278-Amphidinium_carterae.2
MANNQCRSSRNSTTPLEIQEARHLRTCRPSTVCVCVWGKVWGKTQDSGHLLCSPLHLGRRTAHPDLESLALDCDGPPCTHAKCNAEPQLWSDLCPSARRSARVYGNTTGGKLGQTSAPPNTHKSGSI